MAVESNPDRWVLHESDLPPRSLLESDLRFRDIEHNAAFRIAIFEQHGHGWRRRDWLDWTLPVVSLIVLLAPLVILSKLWPRVTIFIAPYSDLLFFGYLIFALDIFWKPEWIDPLQLKHLRDLAKAGLSGPELAVGLWAAHLRRRRLCYRFSSLIVAFCILWVLVFAIPSTADRIWYELLLYPTMALTAYNLALGRTPSQMELRRLSRWMGQSLSARSTGTDNNIAIKLGRTAHRWYSEEAGAQGLRYFKWFSLLAAAAIPIGVLVSPIVRLGLSVAVGAAGGYLSVRYARQHTESYFGSLCDYCGAILEIEGVEPENLRVR